MISAVPDPQKVQFGPRDDAAGMTLDLGVACHELATDLICGHQ
jgi:hypothetical protein